MVVRNEVEALKRISEHAGRFMEHCRRLTRAADSVERHLSRGAASAECSPAVSADPLVRLESPVPLMTLPARELQHLCDAAHKLPALWEAMVLSVAQHAARAAPPEGRSRRPRVLIVDDSPDLRDLLAELVNDDFEVFTAADGLDAVMTAHAVRPSVVLMDITMPVLDGIDAARLLKTSAETRDTPIVAHTAHPQACQDVEAERLFAEVLRKPLGPTAVVTALRRYAE